MELITILINYIKFLLPLSIYIIWFFVFYFVIKGGLRLLKIKDVPDSKIRIYILIMIILGLFIKPLIYSTFSSFSNKIVPYLADLFIDFLMVFSLLKYYFHLSGKKLWQFLLYLISINILFNLVISGLL